MNFLPGRRGKRLRFAVVVKIAPQAFGQRLKIEGIAVRFRVNLRERFQCETEAIIRTGEANVVQQGRNVFRSVFVFGISSKKAEFPLNRSTRRDSLDQSVHLVDDVFQFEVRVLRRQFQL